MTLEAPRLPAGFDAENAAQTHVEVVVVAETAMEKERPQPTSAARTDKRLPLVERSHDPRAVALGVGLRVLLDMVAPVARLIAVDTWLVTAIFAQLEFAFVANLAIWCWDFHQCTSRCEHFLERFTH